MAYPIFGKPVQEEGGLMAEVRGKPTFRTLNEQPAWYQGSSFPRLVVYVAIIVSMFLGLAGYLRYLEVRTRGQEAITEVNKTNQTLQTENTSLRKTVDQLSERVTKQEQITVCLESRISALEHKKKPPKCPSQ
jgi:hypothetical protein